MSFGLQIDALDQLHEHLDEVVIVLRELETEVGTIQFDPHDDKSVGAAIERVENDVDRRLLPFLPNDLVARVGAEFKSKAAENIRLRAKEESREA